MMGQVRSMQLLLVSAGCIVTSRGSNIRHHVHVHDHRVLVHKVRR